MKTYAAYYDHEIRKSSSSGGIFSLLAQQFEVVYGVAMTENCYGAEFVRAETDIAPLRGSKYLQAKVGDTFRCVKKDLTEGKTVLFTGTGCQINGLRMFLGQEYEGLVCVDVVCHGIPSPKLWKKYAAYQESKYGKLEQVNFRCKDNGWKNFGIKENRRYMSMRTNSFMRMFLRNYCLRPSCYECQAKSYKTADLTIGDFWGIENSSPEMNDDEGISLVITRTEQGQKLFDLLKGELKWKEVSYEEGVKSNSAEYASVPRPAQRDSFFFDLDSLSFKKMEKKYASDRKASFPRRLMRKIKSFLTQMAGSR